MNLVSIIVPIYNGEKYIDRCIDSLINQTYENIEIILIDDGSKDGTLNIINKYIQKDRRIKVYTQINSGPSIARNYGLGVSSGEYITFCDSDDYVKKTYIEELMKSIVNLEVDIVSSGYIDISKYGTVELNDFYRGKLILSKEEFVSSVFRGVGGTLWGKIFKKEIISKYNLRLNPNIYMCEDMIFVLEYSMKCVKFGAIDQNSYSYYRLNENSISKRINMKYYQNFINVLEEIERILRCNEFSKIYIDSILSNRAKNLIINFILIQSSKDYKYSKLQKIKNIEYIIMDRYSQRYLDSFIAVNNKEKLMIKLMINKKYNALIFYSAALSYVQRLKDKVRRID